MCGVYVLLFWCVCERESIYVCVCAFVCEEELSRVSNPVSPFDWQVTFHCSKTFLLNTAVAFLQLYTTTLGVGH